MKKFMVALLAVLMLSSVAYAANLDVSGSYYTRGRYFSNPTLDQEDDYSAFANYDHEFDLHGVINVDDTTFVRFRMEIEDLNWPGDSSTTTTAQATTDVNGDGAIDENDTVTVSQKPEDDGILVQRIWGGHTFATGTKLEVGKMSGGAWAYDFANTEGDFYRVKVSQAIPMGTLFAILQKDAENGSNTEDSEKNDVDTYYLAAVLKAGALNIKPLLGYNMNGATDLNDDSYNTLTVLDVGVDGVFGIVGFETEVQYKSYSFDETDADDYSLYGLYLDVYANLDAVKPGIFFAYGSVDDDSGAAFSFGDDFDGHGAEMIGNEFSFGGVDAIGGATYFGDYANFAASDALSFFGQIGYAKGNSDSSIEDDTCLDVSARGSYKITDAVTYTIGAGYAKIDRDATDDPDPGYKLYHKFNIAF